MKTCGHKKKQNHSKTGKEYLKEPQNVFEVTQNEMKYRDEQTAATNNCGHKMRSKRKKMKPKTLKMTVMTKRQSLNLHWIKH